MGLIYGYSRHVVVVVEEPCTAEAAVRSNRMEKEALMALRRAFRGQCTPGAKSLGLLVACVKRPSNSILSFLI